MLQDKPQAGAFTFQVTLHKNGDIVFVYSVIPITIELIEDTMHPVKIGLSDAYIMDRTVFCEFALALAFVPLTACTNNRARTAAIIDG